MCDEDYEPIRRTEKRLLDRIAELATMVDKKRYTSDYPKGMTPKEELALRLLDLEDLAGRIRMKETVEIMESEDGPHIFVATFQEPSIITTSGTGPTPVAALLSLISELTTRRDAFALQRDVLSSALLEELLATEDFLSTFWDT